MDLYENMKPLSEIIIDIFTTSSRTLCLKALNFKAGNIKAIQPLLLE